ncbi:hypothetical protein EJ08DRAFT_693590 [Tothia fuscella]|uniref:Uncharacterized protein n=1 Tax=Tothia fuscella TaxID=1048955 RepID=A0A9P4P083_9PEZI|nr:hypothetical protein EJ08DRAFT_693590 [Tothia fuscella]
MSVFHSKWKKGLKASTAVDAFQGQSRGAFYKRDDGVAPNSITPPPPPSPPNRQYSSPYNGAQYGNMVPQASQGWSTATSQSSWSTAGQQSSSSPPPQGSSDPSQQYQSFHGLSQYLPQDDAQQIHSYTQEPQQMTNTGNYSGYHSNSTPSTTRPDSYGSSSPPSHYQQGSYDTGHTQYPMNGTPASTTHCPACGCRLDISGCKAVCQQCHHKY